MTTVIIYNTSTNLITHISKGVQSISSDFQSVKGESWEWQGLTLDDHELIVVEDFTEGELLQVRDTLPSNLIDIKERFILPSKRDEIVELRKENSSLKEAQAETNTTLLELMEVVILS